jgi:type 1 fimbria pilin
MKIKTITSIVLVVLPFTAFAAPQGTSGEIRFTGQIVDIGCELGRSGTLVSSESRQVEVRPGLKLDVGTYRNACSRQALPFSVTYEALKTSSDKGIVTVKYL